MGDKPWWRRGLYLTAGVVRIIGVHQVIAIVEVAEVIVVLG